MEKLNNIIIFSSNEYPGNGGAATNTYALIKFFLNMNFNVYGIFYDHSDADIDPDKIGCVIKLRGPNVSNLKSILNYKHLVDNMIKGYPKIIFSKNYYVLQLNQILYPKAKQIYLAGGIPHFSEDYGRISIKQFLLSNFKIPDHKMDLESYAKSDLIIANSLLSQQLMLKIYPQFKNKIYKNPSDATRCIIKSIQNMNINISATRKWDIIIVVSDMKRKVKNNYFLYELLNDNDFNSYSKIIIGNSSEKFKKLPNTTVYNLIPHKQVCIYMAQPKVLLFPSLFDSNPNTVREAIYFKCLVLTTDTIGFYDRFPEISLCKSFNKEEWKTKSLNLIKNYENIIQNYSIDFSMEEDFEDFVYNLIEN